MASNTLFSINHLEIHVTHRCNMHCRNCHDFCDFQFNGEVDDGLTFASMKSWSKRIYPAWFRILGGEPLLNPNIPQYLKVAATCFPNARRDLVTNGLLLKSWVKRGLADMLCETNTELTMSLYRHHNPRINALLQESLEIVDDFSKKFKIKTLVIPRAKLWFSMYQGEGKDITPYEDNVPKMSYLACHATKCTNLHQGKLWQCPTLAYLPMIFYLLKHKERWKPFLEYKPLTVTCSDQEIERFIQGTSRFCGSCPSQRTFAIEKHFDRRHTSDN